MMHLDWCASVTGRAAEALRGVGCGRVLGSPRWVVALLHVERGAAQVPQLVARSAHAALEDVPGVELPEARGRPAHAPGCTADFRHGLVVTVLDASTGSRICNARVTASDGAYQEVLTTSPQTIPDGGIDCAYQGAGERAGTYSVDARLDARETMVSGIIVDRDQCHVIRRQVSIRL